MTCTNLPYLCHLEPLSFAQVVTAVTTTSAQATIAPMTLALTATNLSMFQSTPRRRRAAQDIGHVSSVCLWQMTEGAYALEQSIKPHTLAVALGDCPGRAACLDRGEAAVLE